MAQSADPSPIQHADTTTNSTSSPEQLPAHPEFRGTASGIPISYSLSDADAEEMISIVRQHTQNAILGIVLDEDGRVFVDTGIENRGGISFEFRRDDGKWKLIKQQDWIS